MAEANTSVAEDQEGRAPLVNEEEEPGQSELSPRAALESSRRPESGTPVLEREETEVPPPPPPAPERASTGWPDEMEDALTSSSITEEHHALMVVVLQSLWSVDSGLKEAFNGLLTSFKASSSAAAVNAEELAELNQKLKSSEDDLSLVNKRFDEAQATAAEVENLKAALRTAQLEAAEQRSAAEQSATELTTVKTASQKHKARVAEMQQELADAVTKCEALEQKNKEQAAELTSPGSVAKEARTEARGYQEELRQVKLIADGTFADLPRSAADATRFFAAQEGRAKQRLFWAQFQAPEHPPLLKLHRMAEPMMKDLCVKLWPSKPLPSSYFGLVQRLYDTVLRIDACKRSACIEGTQMAFGKTMVHWPKIKSAEMATRPPPPGKEHRRPEQYFPIVMDGAWAIKVQCSKDVIYE